eukprot:scaffold267402_cov21-Tisochrysis_lutea.AAC.1
MDPVGDVVDQVDGLRGRPGCVPSCARHGELECHVELDMPMRGIARVGGKLLRTREELHNNGI